MWRRDLACWHIRFLRELGWILLGFDVSVNGLAYGLDMKGVMALSCIQEEWVNE